MACYLRVIGEALEIDRLLTEVGIEPDRIWRKGERRTPRGSSSAVFPLSGASFVASDASMDDFDSQLTEATAFLAEHQDALMKVAAFPGVDGLILDFAIELRDVAVHSDYFPPVFLRLVGQLGIGLELSHYPSSVENNQREQPGTDHE